MANDRLIQEEDKFTFRGGMYTLETFKESVLKESEKPYALNLVRSLQEKGLIKLIENQDENRKIIEQALAEEAIKESANMYEQQVEDDKDAKREHRNKGKLTHKKVKFPFTSARSAQSSMEYIREELRIKDMSIEYVTPVYYLVIKDITEKELATINRYYTAGKLVGAMVSKTESGAKKVTDGINYTAKNVINPIASIGVKSLGSVFSTMAGIVTHTGATLVTSASDGAKRTREQILTDPETLRATRDLINVKDSIKKKFSSRVGTMSGVVIEDD